MPVELSASPLSHFHSCTQDWFRQAFVEPTRIQAEAWPSICGGRNTLLLAPTGSGKTLAAFLASIDRLFFNSQNDASQTSGVRVLYISPLKALGVDVDRNLRAPIAGLRAFAEKTEIDHCVPNVAVRSGDTTQRERNRILRAPPDILITTPESLYLMLTSRADEILASVETVIVDEIHAIAGTKRGVHLFTTLERLERLRRRTHNAGLQRIGLSATQRPLEEIARLLGGGEASGDPATPVQPRPVDIIDASEKRRFELTIETPAEDFPTEQADPESDDLLAGPSFSGPTIPSVWPAIHPRLVELIRSNRSTMIFVNSRRLAERLAAAINEVAEEEIALAHHGSIAKDTRAIIEDRLKRGDLPAMVATSSMELGIDMGAVDLVIQIEAPPSIASGIQRIGRAGHQVGAISSGVVFPKYRGDLLACSAAVGAMLEGWVEETAYPRNTLDILAQQIVAIVSREEISVDDLFALIRGAAPFFDLPQSSFVGVLDLLSGRYPSDEFSDLRPRITWDRVSGMIQPRRGAQRLAILNGGTIPDRGLYGVYLAGDDERSGGRVGELDEEMVFECRPGDVFLLGASSWRVVDITRDRVLVVPAPGEPGRMPFWRGEGPGRPFEFGRAIGQLTRELTTTDRNTATERLMTAHCLQQSAAESLLDYLQEQQQATTELPTDRTIVIEVFLDEVGDWRIVLLTPFGSRLHAPWAMIVSARLRTVTDAEVDVMWTDDGIVFRLPEACDVPEMDFFFPDPDEVEEDLLKEVGGTAMFAARFRENSARSLLLPRRRPNQRTPLWLQRRRSADLLKVASQYPGFPMLIETHRECLRDVFDLTGLVNLLREVRSGAVRTHLVRTQHPSPFAGAILFNYAGNFIYDGDAPLAERRAQTLALDHTQLRELLGTIDLRELFDRKTVEDVALEVNRLKGWQVNHPDAVHDLLLQLGSLSEEEIERRTTDDVVAAGQLKQWLADLVEQRRIFSYRIGSGDDVVVRFAAAEDAGRLRDALGIMAPPGLADAFLEPVQDALTDLVSQFARTHGPFTAEDVAERLGLGVAPVLSALQRLREQDRIVEGEFRPGRTGQEWCDVNVLRTIKRRSLAVLRKEVEPVTAETLAQFLPDWHNIVEPRRGLDGILDAIEQLQGAPLPASTLEEEILPARIQQFRTSDLDELCVQGEIVWRGFDRTGSHDGRIGLYLTDHYLLLAPPVVPVEGESAEQLRTLLKERGGLFFDQITAAIRDFPNDILQLLWQMVWAGELSNDTLTPLRSLLAAAGSGKRSDRRRGNRFRSRRQARLPGSEGRWSLLPVPCDGSGPTATERQTAISRQLIERHGVLTREMLAREEVDGGFAGLYPVLKAMEEAGRVRRGYFVEGLGAAQFAAPGADDRLRASRTSKADASPQVLAATDPASPWGNALPWPEVPEGCRLQRVAGARVITHRGQLLAYLSRGSEQLTTFLPAIDVDSGSRAVLARALADLAEPGRSLVIRQINGLPAGSSELKSWLEQSGFTMTSRGLMHRGQQEHARR